MNFAIIGGDERSLRLMRLFKKDGHNVSAFALENAVEGCCETAEEALSGADCAVLPLPCIKDGHLNCPFSQKRCTASELLSCIDANCPVLAGKAESLEHVADFLGLRLRDYSSGESFAMKNAILTAEAAIELASAETKRPVRGAKTLVCGFGRIGSQLALRLLALGADVSVLARSSTRLAFAESLGCHTAEREKEAFLGGYDWVFNTVPARIFSPEDLCALKGAEIYELASAPYGFDMEDAEKAGVSAHLAAGLPGKYFPQASAEIVRDSIYGIMEEFL